MTAWPENVRCHEKPAFEPIYRHLLETAAAFLELLDKEKRDLPLFSGGHNASPKNQTAEEMWNQLEAALTVASSDAVLTNIERVKAFTFAVRSAYVIRGSGYGTKGWAHFFSTLQKVKPAPARPNRPDPAAREPETITAADVVKAPADLLPR